MTDGIIQEVFKIYKDRLLSHTLDRKTHRDFDNLQEELIEKIKKEFYDVVEMNEEYILKTLIGDNNE